MCFFDVQPFFAEMIQLEEHIFGGWVETNHQLGLFRRVIFNEFRSHGVRYPMKKTHHHSANMFTLQGTNISPKNGILKMIFLFPRWDMLISWRVVMKCLKGFFASN